MIIGCSHAEKFDDTWRPPPVNHPVEYVTDSLYVVHTVNEFIRVEYNIFHYYHTFKIPEHEITIYIDSLVYSPDSLKMIAFVGIKSPSLLKDSVRKYQYTTHYFVGFRNTRCEAWKMYNFISVNAGVAFTYKKMYNNFRLIMFKHFAEQEEMNPVVCPDTVYESQFYAVKNQDYTMMKYGVNLGEPGFWTEKNLMWRQGVRVEGLYNFQTDHHQATSNRVLPYPELRYPDSLLSYYRKQCE